MTSSTNFLGIDLGTTNSVAVLVTDATATPVRTADGGPLLPSVVRIDTRGNPTVGARARRFLESDPENTRSEFKRLMGTERKLAFKSAKLERSPEELSALVLGALRGFAEQALGHAPAGAVVTVPALFELPQIRATSEAARLAGFERVEHLQEPVASALTAGWGHEDDGRPWLVYDLGGGTFDASILETREGVLRVVEHDGDNFLGGRDMDARILEYVLELLGKELGRPLGRGDAALGASLRRLRAACEDAKIELGLGRDTAVTLAEPLVIDGSDLVVDVPIDRATFEDLVLPTVDRSIEVCARLLARQGLTPDRVGRIVLVGGPTVMECLRDRLAERLGIPLATDVDPMTAVAEGAARFAAERDIGTQGATHSATPAAKPAPTARAGASVWLQCPSVSGDLFPFVVGRVTKGKLAAIRARRADGGFTSERESVAEDGTFAIQVELVARASSTFTLEGEGEDGKPIALAPPTVTIRHGLSLSDPPLSRTIGVALASGGVQVYFERGAPLPSRKTFRFRTSLAVAPGANESALTVPIVQGEVDVAHLCRLVGRIDIKGSHLKKPLAAGSTIEVVLELDRGGKLTASAQVPGEESTIHGTVDLVAPDAAIDELEKRLAGLSRRAEGLYVDPIIGEAGKKRLHEIDGRLREAEREAEAARGADPDAVEKLRRLLIDADAGLEEVEAIRTWPELEARATDWASVAMHWISRSGSASDRRALEETLRSLERARALKNPSEFGKRIRALERIAGAACFQDPDGVRSYFRHLASRVGEARDPRAARALIGQGDAAIAKDDMDALRKTCNALDDLLPATEEERAKAHGSGVVT